MKKPKHVVKFVDSGNGHKKTTKNEIFNLLTLIFVGNLALICLLGVNKFLYEPSYKLLPQTLLILIMFVCYYILLLKILLHYTLILADYLGARISKIIGYCRKNPENAKKMSAVIGLLLLYMPLRLFLDNGEIIKIYGIGGVTYFLSFLISKNQNNPKG